MTTGKIRWGIMGLGRIAHKFASDITLAGGSELVAVGSRNADKAAAFAKEFGGPKAYGSYEALVADPDVDIIYVATPHSHHHSNTILCLEHGKHVLCEKAFAVTAWQAAEMIKLAREKKLFLMEALWTKFLPHYLHLMELLKQELVGEIRSVIVDFGFVPAHPVPVRLVDPKLAGGTLLDIGIYNVFMATSVLGQPDYLEAHISPMASGVDEQCAILFKYRNGAMAQLFSTFATNLGTEAVIAGTRGRIKLHHRFYAPECTLDYYPGRPDTKEDIEFNSDVTGFGYQHEIRHVEECLANGLTESPSLPLNETLQRMELLDAIRQKAGLRYPEDNNGHSSGINILHQDKIKAAD